MMRSLSLGLALLFVAGCGPELGSCDPAEARRLVYNSVDGSPAFEGQAMMIASCGNGAFCHSTEIRDEYRLGVPIGLEYDLRLASFGTDTNVDATGRLRDHQLRAFVDRHSIWDQVSSGRMPVSGFIIDAIGDPVDILEAAPTYVRFDLVTGMNSPSPSVDTDAGREVLRNWLSCGLPVVERTVTPSDDPPEIPEEVGWIVAPQMVEPLEPTWESIYTLMIEPRCNSAPCHGSSAAGELQLDQSQAEALTTLMGGMGADPEDCGGPMFMTPYINTADPDASLFIDKLTADPDCGRRMPIGGSSPITEESLDAIRQWMMDGANP